MPIWDKLQLRASRGSKGSIGRGRTSVSSHDSGYGSLGASFEHDKDKSSTISPDLINTAELIDLNANLEPASDSATTKQRSDNNAPEALPLDGPPIDPQTHRIAKAIVYNFRRGFASQLARHLNSPQCKTARQTTTHAIAIFPSVAWKKDSGFSQVAVDIIIQCHPSAETHVRQFLDARRAAIDSFLLFARKPEPGVSDSLLVVEIRVVGREITFLYQPSVVYTQSSKSQTGPGFLEVPGKSFAFKGDARSAVKSTLGGLISVSCGSPHDVAWFGMTTAHGFQAELENDNQDVGARPLALVIEILGVLGKWREVVVARAYGTEKDENDNVLLVLLRKCGHATKRFARAQCLQIKVEDALNSSNSLLKSVHVSLLKAQELPFVQQKHYLTTVTESLWAATEGHQYDKQKRKDATLIKRGVHNHQSGQHVGYLALSSVELFKEPDLTAIPGAEDFWENDPGQFLELEDEEDNLKLDDGNYDWALLDLVHARSERCPFSSYRNDVFDPSNPSADVEHSPKVILLNRDMEYPEGQISPQVAFLSFPPSIEPLELLTLELSGSETFSPGDSGSWVISINEAGKKVVHGQLVAVNCMGDGLLLPMERIVADIHSKLSPIFEPWMVVKTHVPMDALNLEDMADFVRDWLVPRMDEKEQILAWKFMKLGMEAAMTPWREVVENFAFSTYESSKLWTAELKEFKHEIQTWDRYMEAWKASGRSGPLLRGQWAKDRLARREIWHKRVSYWRNYMLGSNAKRTDTNTNVQSVRRSNSESFRNITVEHLNTLNKELGTSPFTRAMRRDNPCRSLGKSNSSRGTGSYRSLWSCASSVGTTFTSAIEDESDQENFDTIKESEDE